MKDIQPTYDSVNCNECENDTCPYREENGKPYYCPNVEEGDWK
jgi:hypothetical protein